VEPAVRPQGGNARLSADRAAAGYLGSEQRRPEQDPGRHLADHRRLAHAGEQPGQELADDDRGGERDRHVQQDVGRRQGPRSYSGLPGGGC
jgi:hypothetical protein